MSDFLNIILNGKIVKGESGESILDLARRYHTEIPTLCHDPRIEPFTSCFICVVEVEGYRGLQPSCSTKIVEGMKIVTENDRIRKARKTALDLLLSNHYADCMGPCKQTCPAGVDVQGYISYIEKGMYHEAVALIKETNPLPAICGRVCVRPCEVACRRNLLNEGAAVGIDYMKRFASDYDLASPDKWRPEVKPETGKKVAIIGAGPAGLSSAFFLRKEGHEVDIFEAAPQPGGWLRYGIPEYRLPNDLLQKEVDNITELGVRIHYKMKLGDNLSYKDLKVKYDAVILGIGSQKGTSIGCEGDDAENVLSGIDFLKQMELTGKRFDFKGKKVAVIGGGNTAMDCCRSSVRCGADEVFIIYRRTEKEMPANPIEIHESKLEGVKYMLLTNPLRINKDDKSRVKSINCLKMALGEPDTSGRRRPIPVEGSEFDVPVDYILAAIGQKTHVNFLDDINDHSEDGKLKTNKWGDLDTNPMTLQTGIESMFAAGDGVTGPATLIEAIAQARIASRSCHQFLMKEKIEPPKQEFLSKKDNFKPQLPENYTGLWEFQARQEMPTLDPIDRLNFNEVELGYAGEEVAQTEAQRCLECGCSEYFTCDLKKYSTDYDAEQKKYPGDFREYHIDFRHPYIEIDNNKCILCSRCVRICKEVVGANALGLVNRGFDTYVAPSMGNSLQDTTCESCGMCISTCPTGAITENVPFKPGPVRLKNEEAICNFCSIGCRITMHHTNGFVMRVSGAKGMVNTDGNICRYPKFGYRYLNNVTRINKPLYRKNGRFEEISFKKAFQVINEHIKEVQPDENVFFAGARLTNEEQYLIQKLARAGAGTNNVSSFHYLNRGEGYLNTSVNNVPFDQLAGASKIYLLGSETNIDNGVPGFMVNVARQKHKIPVSLITTHTESKMEHKADDVLHVKSYYHFLKSVNFYLVANGFENKMFIKDNCTGFEEYVENLMKENFVSLIQQSGVGYMDRVVEFAKNYNHEMNAVIVFSEKELTSEAAAELVNLCMITGKYGKTSSGFICLKEKNNTEGLIDMGAFPAFGPGIQDISSPEFIKKLKSVWKVNNLPAVVNSNIYDYLEHGMAKNIFIFGEDPVGCATEKVKVLGWLSAADFVVVQDYFMTESARHAHLILPASLPFETGGSFTNTGRMIQTFDPVLKPRIEMSSHHQLIELLKHFGSNQLNGPEDVNMEVNALFLPVQGEPLSFTITDGQGHERFFRHGCDIVNKMFDDEFAGMTKR